MYFEVSKIIKSFIKSQKIYGLIRRQVDEILIQLVFLLISGIDFITLKLKMIDGKTLFVTIYQ